MKNFLKFFKNVRFYNILQQKEFAQAEQELNILQHDLNVAKKFLKEQRKFFFQRKSIVPRYIIIGSSRSGKTTLLSQSGLGLVDINQLPLNDVAPTKNCSWWFTADGIYLDTAGIYTKPDIERPRDEIIWTGFIKSLKKQFGKNPLHGVIIALDLPAISTDKALLQQTLFYVRDRLYEIARFADQLPIYIVFTKCDLISGFTTFFEHLDLEQRNQICGIDFTGDTISSDPSQQFNLKFDLLLQQLNKQLVTRLHQEHNPEHRMLINNFPLQLESLRSTIAEVLNKVPFGANIKLRGIFFTSSIQEGRQIDYLKNSLQNIITFSEETANPAETQSNHSFFTADLFKKFINHSPNKIDKLKILAWVKYFAISALTLVIICWSLYFWHKSFQTNVAALQSSIITLKSPVILNDFDKLKQLTDQLDQQEHSNWMKFGINQVHSLNTEIKKIYQTVTANTYIFQAQQAIEAELTSANTNSNPRSIYDDLKIYLMLANSEKIDHDFTKQWFHNYAIARFPNDLDKQLKLKEAVDSILNHNIKIKTDPKIIAQARQTLSNMPKNALLYLLLENKFGNSTIALNAEKFSDVFANFAFNIPDMYTAANFQKIYKKEIPNLVDNPKFDDWVFSNNLHIQIDKNEKDKLIVAIQTQYLESYATAWDNAFKNLNMHDVKDIAHLTQHLNLLADNNSPIIQLLKLLRENSTFKDAPPQLLQLLDLKLQNLTHVDLAALQNNLSTFSNYITTINKSPDINKAAFAAAVSRFQDSSKHDPISLLQNFAAQQPKPLQTWLLSLSTNTWDALLGTARNYISNTWKESVYPQFQKLANNKYPIFKDSPNELSLTDFNKLFGPNGIIDGFFTVYIKPFVDTDQMYWVWKDVDGQKLNFSQNSLEVFIRAALIQKMYYPDGATFPTARFTLTPLDMTPRTQSFNLNLEGQAISYKKGVNKADQLVWPGPTPGNVSIDFINKDGKHFSSSMNGAWAWFKLLEKANIQPINNSQHFELTFDLNGNAIKYELITAEPVSPFIPQIISDFRCPENL